MMRNTYVMYLIIIFILIANPKLPVNSINSEISSEILKSSQYVNAESGFIHIDGYNWTTAKSMGWCTGNGTYLEPYIIQDLSIKGEGSWDSGILINDSCAFFIIQNCTFDDSEKSSFGIFLDNVTNGLITNNSFSTNYPGIYLYDSDNNTLSDNVIYSLSRDVGIYLTNSKNNTLINNLLINELGNEYYGIYLINSGNTTLLENKMHYCSLGLSGSLNMKSSLNISSSNLINGKPLYYYINKTNLGNSNFKNAGQVILINCSESLISSLVISNCFGAISLYNCDKITLRSNNIGNTIKPGVILYNSNNSLILENFIVFQIEITNGYNNKVTNNTIQNGLRGGIKIYGGGNNVIKTNHLHHFNEAIFIISSNNNSLEGNIVLYNEIGIKIISSHSNSFTNNEIQNNNEGIYLSRSHYNMLSNNVIHKNGCGIVLEMSNYNCVTKNSFSQNSVNIIQTNCDENTIYNNQNNELTVIGTDSLFFSLLFLTIGIVLIMIKRIKSIKGL